LPHTRLSRFQIKFFEPEAVVFDTASGDTHFLASHTVALFQIIQTHPGMTRDQIEAALAARLSMRVSPEFSHMTNEALASLRQIGMLETP
jgi:PqqD family protein of HPr-rel-A system